MRTGERVRHAYHGTMERIHGKLKQHATSKRQYVMHAGNEQWHKAMKHSNESHGSKLEDNIKRLASGAPTENQVIALPTEGVGGGRAL